MSLDEIEIRTRPPCAVRAGRGALGLVAESIPAGRGAAVLTDHNVVALHLERLGRLARGPVLAVVPGEGSKSLATLEVVLGFLAEARLDRSSVLVALGGGVVGDLGGLAAALYMRGIDVVQCPTTLVAQVDAAIGGKTAVNLAAGKNLAGVFHQPRAVFADVDTLATLAEAEFRSGLGEVLKSALIGDVGLLELLEESTAEVLGRDADVLVGVVGRCVRVKAEIVARDEREAGERKKLNLGHTFAHAIERAAGYGVVPHGVAVGTGLALALGASARTGLLRDPELLERITALLERLDLCPTLAALRERYGKPLAPDELLEAMRHDKKGAAGSPAFVLPERVGALALDRGLERGVLLELLA